MPISTSTPFFADPANTESLNLVARLLRASAPETDSDNVAAKLRTLIEMIAANPALFDQHCRANIDWIGEQFIGQIRAFPNEMAAKKEQMTPTLFILAYRFQCELEFMMPTDHMFELRDIEGYVSSKLNTFTDRDQKHIAFARFTMPAQIAAKILQDPALVEFRKFSYTINDAKQLKTDWDADLTERQNFLTGIKDGLKQATSTYNFVGLVDGFRHMASKKSTERLVAFLALLALAAMMIIPPGLQIFYVLTYLNDLEGKRDLLLLALPAILAIEVILIYLFRVVLAQFRSVKAQVLQLDLRIALCQFVESYAEYSKKISKDNPSTLAMFESIVFSNVASDTGSVPSTFDGVEPIAKLINSLRGAKS